MAVNSPKSYVDRAIQTDFGPSPSVEQPIRPALPPESSEDNIAQLSALEPPSLVRYLQKPHFSFNGPSSMLCVSLASRVVSLPETVPPVKVQPESKGRVVSLTEAKSFATEMHCDIASSDRFDLSMSSDPSQNSSDNSILIPQNHARHSMIPRTPSPPSSPESVMIIGNDVHVSQSFLNHKRCKAPAFHEKDGWMSWSNSPPRPIPALHGPLSLPYARCPSGAEGTIIEGEDFTRIVWGLGNTDRHGHSDIKHPPQAEKTTEKSYSNIERPSYRSSDVHPCGIDSLNSGKQPSALRGPLPPTNTSNIPPKRQTPAIERVSRFYEPYSSLGLKFSEPPHAQLSRESDRFNPVIISHSLHEHGVPHPTTPHIFIDSRDNPGRTSQVIIPSGHRMSALDLAHQFRLKQQYQQALLTPPQSTEFEWSPRFPSNQVDLAAFSDAEYLSQLSSHNSPHLTSQYQFNKSQLVPQHYDDIEQESQELRNFVFNQIASPQKFLDITRSNDQRQPRNYHQQFSLSPSNMSPYLDPSRIHTGSREVQSLSYPSPEIAPSTHSSYVPPSPTSPRAPRLENIPLPRQPRSIPFARLMQRRLSAVPEEDESRPSMPARERRSHTVATVDLGNQPLNKEAKASLRFNRPMPSKDVARAQGRDYIQTDIQTKSRIIDKENVSTSEKAWSKPKH